MRKTAKGIRFEELIMRADKALEDGYFIESITLYYAFIEERMLSLFSRLGYSLNRNEKLFYCLKELENLNLDSYFPLSLLNGLDAWRVERNNMIHDFAKKDIDYSDLQEVAENGKNLGKELSAAIMRHKKHSKK